MRNEIRDKRVAIIISPNWHNYAEKYLRDCIESIRAQDYSGEIKIFLTDNETSPESFQLLRKIAPEAELVLNKTNDGFAKGNNDSIRLALQEDFQYIILVNMDAVLEPTCVSELAKAAESDEKIGIVQARIMLWPDKNKINSLGNTSHFLGFGYCQGYQEDWQDQVAGIIDIGYPSGSAFLAKYQVFKKIGLFDEEFWMYNEDQDLGWRAWLAGFRNVLATEAVCYHKYEFSRSIEKYYWMDRNRIISILKNYHLLTLILIMPAFLVMELGLILFSFKTGWFKDKLRVWRYFLRPTTWSYLARARRETQNLRKSTDKEIVKMISGKIWYQEIGDWKLRFINPFFNLYWKVMKLFIIW